MLSDFTVDLNRVVDSPIQRAGGMPTHRTYWYIMKTTRNRQYFDQILAMAALRRCHHDGHQPTAVDNNQEVHTLANNIHSHDEADLEVNVMHKLTLDLICVL